MHAMLAILMTMTVQTQETAKLSSSDLRQIQAACSASPGQRPRLAGIEVVQVAATAGDSPYLRITDSRTGASMRAYYDVISERAAWSRAACFGMQLRLLDSELGGARDFKGWHAAMFTASNDSTPTKGSETRWRVETNRDGALTPTGETMAAVTLPHEQVHAYQDRSATDLPRWFREGHAEWIGREVARVTNPRLLSVEEAGSASRLSAATKPVDLTSWGDVQPTREAFLRQLTSAERDQVLANNKWPADMAKRSFTFGPGDLVSDESNTGARYEAAWSVFRALSVKHGHTRVQLWASSVLSLGGRVRQSTLVQTARRMLDEDLTSRLN